MMSLTLAPCLLSERVGWGGYLALNELRPPPPAFAPPPAPVGWNPPRRIIQPPRPPPEGGPPRYLVVFRVPDDNARFAVHTGDTTIATVREALATYARLAEEEIASSFVADDREGLAHGRGQPRSARNRSVSSICERTPSLRNTEERWPRTVDSET